MDRTITYVEDDPVIRENYSDMLRDEGFQVITYGTKVSVIDSFKTGPLPDLALLDVSLQGERDAGYQVCMELRRLSDEIPIIFLTSHDAEFEKISGMRLGADDYITKDVSLEYIVIRIEALFRRLDAIRGSGQSGVDVSQAPTELTDLLFDDACSRVEWHGNRVDLPLTQYWILKEICRQPGQIRSHRELMKAANIVVEPNTITAHVKAIRDCFRKLQGDFDCIRTERGRGYRWVPN